MVDLDFLASIPIFSFFTRPELEAAQKLFREVTFAKGDPVVRIGEPGDTFYVVLDGELDVWDASVPPRQTGTLRQADFFGEMALLQGGKRTATVKAARRAQLLAVDKPAFDQLFLKNPKAIEYFARVLSKRLAGVTRAERIRRATTTISVASPEGLKGETLLAFSLAVLLKDRTKTEVVYVEVRPGDEADPAVLDLLSDSLNSASRKLRIPRGGEQPMQLQITVPPGLNDAKYGDLLSNLVSKLSDHFSFIVIDLGSRAEDLIESAPAYSDVFITIVNRPGDPTGVPDPRSMTGLQGDQPLQSGVTPAANQQQRAVRDPAERGFHGADDAKRREYVRANPRSAAALPLHRLAHKLLGTSIGLALGGGAAFGLAHLGVLRELERQRHLR